jgi:hypothetical protein
MSRFLAWLKNRCQNQLNDRLHISERINIPQIMIFVTLLRIFATGKNIPTQAKLK